MDGCNTDITLTYAIIYTLINSLKIFLFLFDFLSINCNCPGFVVYIVQNPINTSKLINAFPIDLDLNWDVKKKLGFLNKKINLDRVVRWWIYLDFLSPTRSLGHFQVICVYSFKNFLQQIGLPIDMTFQGEPIKNKAKYIIF